MNTKVNAAPPHTNGERHARRSVLLYLAIITLQGMVFYAPVSALYRQYHGVSFFQITIIESCSLALTILLEMPWGIVADRIGYKRTLLICNIVFFISKLIFWQADSFGDFLFERILLAVVFAGFSGVDVSYLAGLVPEQKHQCVFGLSEACGTAGLIFSALIFPLILDDGYRTAALLTMLAYGAAMLLTLPLDELPITRSAKGLAGQLAEFKATLPRAGLLPVITGAAFMTEINQSFLSQLLYTRAGISERWFSLLMVGLMTVGLAAPLSERLTRRCGINATPMLLMGATALCCFTLCAVPLPLPTLLCLAGINLCFALYMPWFHNWQVRVTLPQRRATALSAQSTVMNLFSIGVELIFGRLGDISIGLTMGTGGLFCTLGVILFTVYLHTAQRKGN